MARYRGPKARINRQLGCEVYPASKASEKKAYIPGQHGPRLRRKLTPYSVGLREKKKLRFCYGLMEGQFKLAFERAKASTGVTGEVLLQLLETRLDSVVYLMGFARTRRAARQFVTHGHVKVNGRKVNIPSFQVQPGAEIEVKERSSSRQLAASSVELIHYKGTPDWLTVNPDGLRGRVNRMPLRTEVTFSVDEQKIVEFYSR